MCNIETLYSSYQELLLDLDIFGRLVGAQGLDDKEAFKDLLFQEYAKARPIPTLESRDCELSEPVSEDFHVSYRNELELAQGEEVISWDDDDEEDEIDDDVAEDIVLPEDFPKELFRKPMLPSERDSIVCENDYFKGSIELEEFVGDVDTVVSNFGTIEQSDELVYVEEGEADIYDESVEDDTVYEEDVGEDEFDYDDNDGYDYDDDDVYEEEEVYESDTQEYSESSESSQDEDDYFDFEEEEIDFVDEVYDNPVPVIQKPRDIEVTPPPIVLPNLTEPKQTVEIKEDIPSDILQYLRLHPRCEISEVLKHYPRKDLERYIRIGKVIKKGSKVYI